jgi:hypothetical protein
MLRQFGGHRFWVWVWVRFRFRFRFGYDAERDLPQVP